MLSRQQDHVVVWTGKDAKGMVSSLGIANPLAGYVYLVDHSGRIRWMVRFERADCTHSLALSLTLNRLTAIRSRKN